VAPRIYDTARVVGLLAGTIAMIRQDLEQM